MGNPLPGLTRMLAAHHARGGRLALLFDYDGTLAPLAAHPRLARISPAVRQSLRRLSQTRRVTVGVISGRTLDDVRGMVRLRRLCYAGAGGMEIELGGRRRLPKSAARIEQRMVALAKRLNFHLSGFPGAWLEDKRLALTIHYRQMSERQIPLLLSAIENEAAHAGGMRLLAGSMAVEVLPDGEWNKGTAVRALVEDYDTASAAFYAGNDGNDADAFEAVHELGGVSLGIGPRAPQSARYWIADPGGLAAFLSELAGKLEFQWLPCRVVQSLQVDCAEVQ